MSDGQVRAAIGRGIDTLVTRTLRSPVLATVVKIVPTPIRRRFTRFGRRLRRLEGSREPFPGHVRSWDLTAHVVDAALRTCAVDQVPGPTLPGSTAIGEVNGDAPSVRLGDRPSPLPDLAVPYGYDLPTRATFGAFDVSRSRPTLVTAQRLHGRRLHRLPTDWFPAGTGAAQGRRRRRRHDPDDADAFRHTVQRHAAIVDRLGSYPSPRARAHLLACTAACGTPVVVTDPAGLHEFLPAELVATMTGVGAEALLDVEVRDATAYRQWTTAHDLLGMRTTWASILRDLGVDHPMMHPLSVSVVVPTRRPEMIDRWAPQLAAQTHRPLQVVIALHGDEFDPADEQRATRILEDAGLATEIVRVDESAALGEVLRAGTERTDGSLVVKWDDDDLYARGHVADLVRIWDYSGATLVGKACDFVYLRGPDVTVRRIQAAREVISRTMAGGTMCIARDDLDALGGWSPVRRGVDVALIERAQDEDALVYRAMGFGYLMIREAGGLGHTWGAGDEVFLNDANPRRAGLDAAWAMVDPPDSVLAGVHR